jgi:hypothetical protein
MDGTVLSNQMLIMGGGLLLAAALLMAIRRKTRVSLENSLMTQELMIYLGRIATALEKLEPPSSDEVTANVLRRLEEIAHAKPNGKVREIPNH